MSSFSEVIIVVVCGINTLFTYHNREILLEILKQLRKIKK